MGLELARAWVRVRGDSSMLAGDLGGVGAIVRNALKDARTYAASLLIPLAHFGSAFIDQGKGIVNQNEQVRISFETLTGSVEETQKLMKDLINYAARTPFMSSDLFMVATSLTQFGERGEKLMDTLKMLGDASMGSREKFLLLGYVFNQIRGVGHLIEQDFRQLSTRGILSLADLAKHFGVTEQAADKMKRSGKISFEDVRDILKGLTEEGGRFHKGMERQSQSMIGLGNTLSDVWGIFASKIAEVTVPFDRFIIKLKIDLVNALMQVTEATDGFASGMVIGAIAASKFTVAILALTVAIRILRLNWGHLTLAIKGTGIAAIIVGIGSAIGGLIYWFSKTKEAIDASSESSIILGKAWQNIKEAAKELYRSIQEGVVNVFGISIPDALDLAAKATAEKIVLMARGVLWLSEKIKFFADGLSFIFRHAGDLMMINLLELEIGALLLFQDIVDGFRNSINIIIKLFSGLEAFVGSIWKNLTVSFDNWVMHLKAEIASLVAGFKAVARGAGLDEITQAMDDAFNKSIQDQGGVKPPADPKGAAKAFNDAFNNEKGLQIPERKVGQDLIDQLEKERDALQKKINDEENARRDLDPKKPPDPQKDKEDEIKRTESLMKTGRYGFAEFGEKLQNAILEGKSQNNQIKMIGLLEQGVNLQKEQLAEQKNKKPAGLGP